MVNFNQQILSKDDTIFKIENRAFKYGDGVFETLKIVKQKIIFCEEHYFRLMASLRMLRMKIPMDFTFDFFENQILKTLEENKLQDARVRVSVFRRAGGGYLPKDNTINFLIEVSQLTITLKDTYTVDLYKDYEQPSGLLSTIKTTSKLLNVLASIFADENELDNCILLNERKHIVEAINSNIFLRKGNMIYTPSLEEGCLKGIIRSKVIEIIGEEESYTCVQTKISPFEMLKADEVFLTNSIVGIQSITQYRKKAYVSEYSVRLAEKLKGLEELI